MKSVFLSILILLYAGCVYGQTCGNNTTEAGEVCDGTDLNGFDCTTVSSGYVSGTLSCLSNCLGYNKSSCTAGNTINATSCSQADVQSAVNAASHGDTVQVPSGSCTWGASVNITNKRLSIIGTGIGQTLLDRSGTSDQLFNFSGSGGHPFRVSGFEMNGNDSNHGIDMNGSFRQFRIDHNKFTNFDDRAIEMTGRSDGVIDHNEFLDNEITDIVIFADGATAWSRPLVLGGFDSVVFIESNTFTWGCIGDDDPWHAVSSNSGARYVFRYNSLDAAFGACHVNSPIDAHGYCFVGNRGTVSFEVYENLIDTEHSNQGMNFRGGRGVVYNNTMIGSFNHDIHLTNYRSYTSCPNVSPPTTETCHEVGGEGYPCQDQINNLYIWNNTDDGDPTGLTVQNVGQVPNDIVLDRDYFLEAMPGYVPYAYPHPLAIDADTVSPTSVAITAPNDQDTVSGTIQISATAQDETAMDRVEFYRDGSTELPCSPDSTGPEPWTCSWDTTQVADGDYDLSVLAFDTSENSTASVVITVSVDNMMELTFPPVASNLSTSTPSEITFPSAASNLATSTPGEVAMPLAATNLSTSTPDEITFPPSPTGLVGP